MRLHLSTIHVSPKRESGALKYQEIILSLVAADRKADEFGVAVTSTSLAVGKNVPFTGPHVGAIAVQGYAGPFFGIAGMRLLREVVPAEKVIERIMADDPLRESRQVLVVDAAGNTAAWSGASLPTFAGTCRGTDCIAGGCGLSGKELLDACVIAFEAAKGDLAERLLAALAEVEALYNGPELESASLRVSKDEPFPHIDLRIDSHREPVKHLARLLETWRKRNGPPPEDAAAPPTAV